jgi:signal transduction histidine kinase
LKADLPAHYETALYKVLQGALSNVVAHAGAQHVRITLASRRGAVTIRIEDDGKGFNAERQVSAPSLSFGLRAMKDRIELLGGAIRFESQPRRRAAEGGTTIEIRLPLGDIETT